MKRNHKVFNLLLAVTTALSLLMVSCGGMEEKKEQAFISFFTGQVTLQRAGASIPVQVKEPVQDGDFFTVGEKSCLILHSTDGLVIRFEANTEATISSITKIKERNISLNKGKILSSVEKLQKGNGYSVKTPTVVASVRGTQFLTEFDGKNTIVAVGRGKVSVKRTAGAGDEKTAEQGSSAVAEADKETVELRGVNKVETLELRKLEKTPAIDNVEKKTPEELKEIYKDTEKIDEEINTEIIEVTGLSLDEMKTKYGRIDVITLYSGKVINGIIISRGESYKVLTSSGTVILKAKSVRRTDVR